MRSLIEMLNVPNDAISFKGNTFQVESSWLDRNEPNWKEKLQLKSTATGAIITFLANDWTIERVDGDILSWKAQTTVNGKVIKVIVSNT